MFFSVTRALGTPIREVSATVPVSTAPAPCASALKETRTGIASSAAKQRIILPPLTLTEIGILVCLVTAVPPRRRDNRDKDTAYGELQSRYRRNEIRA